MTEPLAHHAPFGLPQACYIDGNWADGHGSELLTVQDPASEQTIAQLPVASVAQADDALRAARSAFDGGGWSRATPVVRSDALHVLADELERNADPLADLMTAEIGAPVQFSRPVHVDSAIELLRWFADAAARGPWPGYEQAMPNHRGAVASRSVLLHEPAGVVAAISAYNFPLLLVVRKLGAALAAGCSVVVMPSPQAPLSTIAFMRVVADTGLLPPGTANLVVGNAEVGARLTTSPLVDMVTFTGSRDVGQRVMAQAAGGIKKVVLELGGKSANIVLPGTTIQPVVKPSILRYALNAGQACGATTRTFIPRSDMDEYVEEARTFLANLTVGDPRDTATVVGPLIRKRHLQSVEGYVDRALKSGAKIEAAASVEEKTGFYLAPLLIGDVTNDAEISQEELFGPVGVVMPYDEIDDAITMANDTQFGLNANVWGTTSEAIEVARRLRSGTVTVNGGGGSRQDVPWGGFGASGIGRESGEAGFREFFEIKHIQWPT